MQRQVIVATVIALHLCAATAATAQTGVTCPITTPPASDVARPGPHVWRYGSDVFGAFLPRDGRWHGMAAEQHYRNKVFWYREGYDGRREPRPAVTVHGRQLDGSNARVTITQATNASHSDFGGWSMLTMVEFPEQAAGK